MQSIPDPGLTVLVLSSQSHGSPCRHCQLVVYRASSAAAAPGVRVRPTVAACSQPRPPHARCAARPPAAVTAHCGRKNRFARPSGPADYFCSPAHAPLHVKIDHLTKPSLSVRGELSEPPPPLNTDAGIQQRRRRTRLSGRASGRSSSGGVG